jgi:hypothetical protein
MIERKKIDRLFQEKFRDFEVAPDEKVWENIEAGLKEKKKRRVIPFWFRLSGVAAALLIGFFVIDHFTNPSVPDGRVVNGDKNQVDTISGAGHNGSGNNNAGENQGQKNNPGLIDSGSAVTTNAKGDNNSNNKQGITTNPGTSSEAVAVSNESQNKPGNGNGNRKKANQKPFNQNTNVLRNTNAENAVVDSHRNKKSKSKKAHKAAMAVENPVMENQSVATNSDKERMVKQNNPQTAVVNSDKEKMMDKNNLHKSDVNSDKERMVKQKDQQTAVVNSDKEKAVNQNNPQKAVVQEATDNPEKKSQETNPDNKNIGIAENTDLKKDTTAVATVVPNALEELLNEKENNVTAKEQKVNRWQITSNVAPIYFSSTSKGSPLDSRFENNKKTYTPSMSYGVGAKYAINKRLSVKSGVNAVALEYNTTDLVFFQTDNARRIENVTPNTAGSFIQVDKKPEGNAVTTLGRTRNQYNGDVNQKIGYVEIPVEMSYKLVDHKFGIELVGGLSTLILNHNEVSIVSQGAEINIGEADNLNRMHFSTNVGVGFKYSFLKSFQANVEPMFKYQINTFSNDAGNFKPYFFGLYTGVSYRF